MKTLMKHIIPNTSVLTTTTLLFTALFHLFSNSSFKEFYIALLWIILGYFLFSCVEFYIIPHIRFKNKYAHFAMDYLMWYVGCALVLLVSGWIGKGALLGYTLEFTLAYFFITRYNLYKIKKEVEEINHLLEEKAR